MQKWKYLAQRELGNMQKARNALELARALEEPLALTNRHRPWNRLPGNLPEGMDRAKICNGDKDAMMMGCMRALFLLKRGDGTTPTAEKPSVAAFVKQMKRDLPEFSPFKWETTENAIRRLAGVASSWQEGHLKDMRMERGRNLGSREIRNAIKAYYPEIHKETESKNLQDERDATDASDLVVTTFILETLARMLEAQSIEGVAWLSEIGMENVKRYDKLNAISKSPRNSDEKRSAAMREKFGIACPETFALLRAQSEIIKEDRDWRWPLPNEEEVPDRTAVRGNGRTEIEDEWRLKAEYPNLYKRMLSAPSEGEIAARERESGVRSAVKEGVPTEFVKECVRMGINESERIIDLFLASGKGKENEAAPEGGEPAKTRVWKAKRRQSGKEVKSAEEKGGAEIRTREDIIGAIQLSEEARANIRDAGFSPKDALNAIVRGFNMAQDKRAAVGNAHMRGDPIRKNIRRYLEIEYEGRNAEKPDVEGLLDYLKSIDVVREFGSSACTRTKDDAMSININPGDAIGKEIVDRVNAVIIEVKKN